MGRKVPLFIQKNDDRDGNKIVKTLTGWLLPSSTQAAATERINVTAQLTSAEEMVVTSNANVSSNVIPGHSTTRSIFSQPSFSHQPDTQTDPVTLSSSNAQSLGISSLDDGSVDQSDSSTNCAQAFTASLPAVYNIANAALNHLQGAGDVGRWRWRRDDHEEKGRYCICGAYYNQLGHHFRNTIKSPGVAGYFVFSGELVLECVSWHWCQGPGSPP